MAEGNGVKGFLPYIAGGIIGVLLIATGVVVTGYVLDRQTRSTQELSRMMVVRGLVKAELQAWYEEHGRYPSSLSDLPMKDIPWGDEGSYRMTSRPFAHPPTARPSP